MYDRHPLISHPRITCTFYINKWCRKEGCGMRFEARREKGWDVVWSTGKSTIWPVGSRTTRAICAWRWRCVVRGACIDSQPTEWASEPEERLVAKRSVCYYALSWFVPAVVRVSLVDLCFLKKHSDESCRDIIIFGRRTYSGLAFVLGTHILLCVTVGCFISVDCLFWGSVWYWCWLWWWWWCAVVTMSDWFALQMWVVCSEATEQWWRTVVFDRRLTARWVGGSRHARRQLLASCSTAWVPRSSSVCAGTITKVISPMYSINSFKANPSWTWPWLATVTQSRRTRWFCLPVVHTSSRCFSTIRANILSSFSEISNGPSWRPSLSSCTRVKLTYHRSR